MFYEFTDTGIGYKKVNFRQFINSWTPTVKRKNVSKYITNIITGDTETSKSIDGSMAWVVMCMITIDDRTFFCRKPSEYVLGLHLIDKRIKDYFNNKNWSPKWTMYFHNLSYDLYFLQKFLPSIDYSTVLGVETSPIRVRFNKMNLELRDSYKLFDSSLAKACNNYKLDISKLLGDWDYDLYRTQTSYLSAKEIKYACYDTIVLEKLLEIKSKEYTEIGKVPLTKTSEVRYIMKNVIGKMPKKWRNFSEFKKEYPKAINCSEMKLNDIPASYAKKKIYYRNQSVYFRNGKWYATTVNQYDRWVIADKLKKIVTNLHPLYKMYQEAYTGGFVHASQNYLDIPVKDVISMDLNSAYPSVMLSYKYVYTYNISIIDSLLTKLQREIDKKYIDNDTNGYIMRLRFTNLTSKTPIHTISKDKVRNLVWDNKLDIFKRIDNGRLVSANSFEITLYDTDFNKLSLFYNWDKCEVLEAYSGEKQYLLDSVKLTTLFMYKEKDKWKKIEKQCKKEYELAPTNENYEKLVMAQLNLMLSKTKLNAIYGCMAMNGFNYFENPYDDIDAKTKETDKDKRYDNFIEDLKEQIKNSKTNKIYTFTIGGQITSYVRGQIFTLISTFSDDFVYSDTDSGKLKYRKEIEEFIKDYNKTLEQDFLEAMNYVEPEYLKDLDIDMSKFSKLPNMFDDDGRYVWFKTLGCKRYIDIPVDEDELKNGRYEMQYERNEDKSFKLINGEKVPFLACTCAGIPKKALKEYLLYDKDNNLRSVRSMFAAFDEGVFIKGDKSGKLTHTYNHVYQGKEINSSFEITVPEANTDNKETTVELGTYIVLTPADYRLTLQDDITSFLEIQSKQLRMDAD